MAKIIKLALENDENNPLTSEEKKELSIRANSLIKEKTDNGTLQDEGEFTLRIGDREVKGYWKLVEETERVKAEALERADFVFDKEGNHFEVNQEVIERQKKKDNILEFAKSMPKGQSTGFFLLAAYIIGYDLDHVEEIKKLKNGESISFELLAEFVAKRDEIIKEITKENREKIERLLASMYSKEYDETNGVHKKDKNKITVKGGFSDCDYEVSQAIDIVVKTKIKFTDEQQMEFAEFSKKAVDKAMEDGHTEGNVRYTFENGDEIEAHWKVNKSKDYVKNLKTLTEYGEQKKSLSVIEDSFKNLKSEGQLGLLLLVGQRMGYEMPYTSVAKGLMIGIDPPSDMKGELALACMEILTSISKDDREKEAADTIGIILTENNN